MEYDFRKIEQKWREQWNESGAYTVSNDSSKPKFYVLDMFPYPSGAGLHVGHPLGYIASDIYARYKRLKGFNVLHPMGYDSFGLPAEQYALETGQHPAITTDKNIRTFRSQLDKIGFCFDWSREVRTSDPSYYRWTQWIFLQLFGSWYNPVSGKAEPIGGLVALFESSGSAGNPQYNGTAFSAVEWKQFSEQERQDILMQHRLAYSSYGEVNWCEGLGTVLANDEVVNGVSERGGFPVVKKKMRQWYLRITAYADRLLQGLETVDFSESLKEQQRNWIGKSQGAEISFAITSTNAAAAGEKLVVYTTRPDTIFGVDFMVMAPEHVLVEKITTTEQKAAIGEYLDYVKRRSDRERMSEVKEVTGCFTGAYAVNPFDGREIPIWIAEYVLAGYGTGAIMAVPCGDQRDFSFAQHFNIPVTNIIGDHFNGNEANPTKDAQLTQSGFLDGMVMRDAIGVVIDKLEAMGIGTRKVNYKMRDAGFSRQRYWGEPFPIVWHNGIAQPQDESSLPLELPHVDKYGPGPEGEGPLANLKDWVITPAGNRETSTMPGYAGSSWYFLRYMDPSNNNSFCDRKASDYWGQVDVYVGGTEHAVGHLLYSRMWTKFLFDRGFIGHDEPYKRLINQGMIQGSSRFVYRVSFHETTDGFLEQMITGDKPTVKKDVFVSHGIFRQLEKLAPAEQLKQLKAFLPGRPITNDPLQLSALHVDVNFVDGVELDIEQFKKWRNGEYAHAAFILEDGKYICGVETEKMSKSKFNTVNPDDLVEKFGADTFRMYEMFLGPVEASKPWDTKGIEGVHRFLKKLWRLFYDEQKGQQWTDNQPTAAELKILHRTIRKIEDDTERFSFNTAVSSFMICVNELTDVKCHSREVLESLLVLLTPYAPHIAEELWHLLGNPGSVLDANYPVFDAGLVAESSKEYPVSVNGKVRTNISIAVDAAQADVEAIVLSNEVIQKWLEGKQPKKIIYVKNKMINVVV
ncbi:MAG: class I tRNA ligase family protein [Bacteroidota bacterium]|nr:class I tRNA ligase family protein [Bacteroidota bacterium]